MIARIAKLFAFKRLFDAFRGRRGGGRRRR
jgi:hypothetical protein